MAENPEEVPEENPAKEKPKYRHIKLPLKTILGGDHVLTIQDAVQRANRIIIKAYQLVRLWTLQQVENGTWKRMILDHKNPIEKEHFQIAFRVIRRDSRIPPIGDEEAESKLKLLREFQDLFEDTFLQEDKEDGSNLTQVLAYAATEMYTAYKNNITRNYEKYLARYVNTYWKRMCGLPGSQRNWKTVKKELAAVKRDLLRGRKRSKKKYHRFIDNCRDTIIPPPIDTEEEFDDEWKRRIQDLKQFPSNYYESMVKINAYLESITEESKSYRMYQIFPQRNDLVPKAITFDTASLIKLLYIRMEDMPPKSYLNANVMRHQRTCLLYTSPSPRD